MACNRLYRSIPRRCVATRNPLLGTETNRCPRVNKSSRSTERPNSIQAIYSVSSPLLSSGFPSVVSNDDGNMPPLCGSATIQSVDTHPDAHGSSTYGDTKPPAQVPNAPPETAPTAEIPIKPPPPKLLASFDERQRPWSVRVLRNLPPGMRRTDFPLGDPDLESPVIDAVG